MNSAVIKWILTRLLPGVVLCGLVLVAVGVVYHSGYQAGYKSAKSDGDTTLASEQKARSDERQQLAQAGQQALMQVRDRERQQRERGDNLARQLADKTFELTQATRLLQLNISKAVSDDNKTSACGYNGLGPHSLQLYSKALGYPGGGHTRAGDSSGQ